jgi:hypothetical protein
METSVEYFHSEIPAGACGAWVIEKVSIPERCYDPAMDSRPDCFKFRPGTYTCLRRGATQFMTDLYDEWWTQRAGIAQALRRGGDVLVTGLGLGLVVDAMLRSAESPVQHVTILEFSPDVVRLLEPHLRSRYHERVEVIEADAFTWVPPAGRRFTVGWHDIWPDPAMPGIEGEMRGLADRYGPCCDWQGFWPQSYADALAGK